MTDDSRYMAPLQLAGQLIMEYGGETYRVEETITRMGRAFGLREVEAFAVPSGVFVSYRKSDGTVETAVRRVKPRGTDLTRVDEVNSVSRAVEAGRKDCDAALRDLERIRDERGAIPGAALPFAAGLSAAGFAAMFGAGWADMAVAAAVGVLVQCLAQLLQRFHMQALISVLLGSLLSALLPMLCGQYLFPLQTEAVIGGALMPMLPGLAMTNAVQDTMRGDMVSGTSHGVQAILTAALVAGGALTAATLFLWLKGGAA